jgi:hypothetical protein
VLAARNADGTHQLKELAGVTRGSPSADIASMESVLIRVLGTPGNTKQGRFPDASQWQQVRRDDVDRVLAPAKG